MKKRMAFGEADRLESVREMINLRIIGKCKGLDGVWVSTRGGVVLVFSKEIVHISRIAHSLNTSV
jgi:hypothetical protein